MPRPHLTRPAAAGAVLLACLSAGCLFPLRESGRPPEGPVRERPTAGARAAAARAEEERHVRLDAETERAVAPVAGSAAADARRYGLATGGRYHVAGCADLRDAPAEGRIEFASCWSAIDANYTPCPKCSPGP